MSPIRSFSKQITASATSLQSRERFLRLGRAAFAFEGERQRGKSDDQRAGFARHLRDDRRRARTGAAAESGANENHSRALHALRAFRRRILRRVVAQLGIAAGAEPARDCPTDLHLVRRDRAGERLHVGVDRDHFGLLHPVEHDAVERVRAGASDADDLDRNVFLFFRQAVVAAELDHGCSSGFQLGIMKRLRSLDCLDLIWILIHRIPLKNFPKIRPNPRARPRSALHGLRVLDQADRGRELRIFKRAR